MHISIVRGDFIFASWENDTYKKYRKIIHDLRIHCYRKINEEHDFINKYEYYRKKVKRRLLL